MDFKNYLKMPAAVAAFLLVLGLCSCGKEYHIIDELGISQHTLNVGADPGYTHIAVYSTGSWTVSLDKETEWASLNKLSGEGMGDFVVSWAGNFGVARDVRIIIRRDKREEVITLIQAGSILSPYIQLSASKVALPRQKQDYELGMSTNLGFCLDDFKARAIYYNEGATVPDTVEVGAGGWVTGYSILQDKVTFSLSENTTGADRRADIVYFMKDAAGAETRNTVALTQSASDPVIKPSESMHIYFANGDTYTVGCSENNIWSLPGTQVQTDVDWISSITVREEGIEFVAEENTTGISRSATVTINCPFQGMSAGTSFEVLQSAEKLLSFDDLRRQTPGTIHSTDLLEGIFISDTSSVNVCSSPQTGQYAFDRSENERTAYLESIDGSYGICLKFESAEENVYSRGDHVMLRLDGATLERAVSPIRYSLTGLRASQFTLLGKNVEIPAKEKKIAQLTDADIYTWVSLQQIEILCKDGAYTNASEGYCMKDDLNPIGAADPRWDVAPLLCTDPSGDVIFMLTNAAAPWRRTGEDMQWNSCLPQGSGTLNGVIVADEVAPVRWGNLGKYQIRMMQESDAEIGGIASRFSNTICEWNWNEEEEKNLTQDEGKGTLRVHKAGYKYVTDYNNPYLPVVDRPNGNGTSNLKGLVDGGALCLNQKWWDFEKGEGLYFDVEFATSGISGSNLVFGIVWGHGESSSSTIFAPSNWDVLYSTDGINFSKLTTIKQRSCAWWSSPQTSQDSAPGLTEHLVKLPGSCFGKSKVTVRVKAADTVTDIAPSTSASSWQYALGIEKGTITTSTTAAQQSVRIGTITVRYN